MLCEKLLESVDRSLKLQCLLYLQSCLQVRGRPAADGTARSIGNSH